MTRYDLRFAGLLAAAVIVIGLGLGYGIGWLTRPGVPAPQAAPRGDVTFYPGARQDANKPTGRIPGYGDVYVNDYADLLDAAAEARIRADMIELYDHTGIEMTVLTIPALADFGHAGPIEPFATRLFNTWGIGNAASNDGVLVLVARGDRRMRIEIGAGYARSWDARMQRVIDDAFLPAFREDRYQQGIEAGVDETIFELTGAYPGEYGAGTLKRGIGRIWRAAGEHLLVALGLLGAAFGGVIAAIRRHFRNRPRRCARCGTLMTRADEEADDAHLDGGQRLEEFLHSVDYDVWHCPNTECGHMEITRHPAWFSSHGACPQCHYRTLSTTTEILERATTSSTGRKRVTYDCRNCPYHDTEDRTIPKKAKSSSGSSRSSFGGGSSSGGGASGSW